jgi:hypothetical protein
MQGPEFEHQYHKNNGDDKGDITADTNEKKRISRE